MPMASASFSTTRVMCSATNTIELLPRPGRQRPYQHGPCWDGNGYPVAGWHNAFGEANIPFAPIDAATHPQAWPNDGV